MYWTFHGSKAIIDLRCCRLSARSEDFWEREAQVDRRSHRGLPNFFIVQPDAMPKELYMNGDSRVFDPWCICFRFTDGEAYDVEITED